jgi:hypothetical protein
VVQVLRKAHEAAFDVEELDEGARQALQVEQMGMQPRADADGRAAKTLLDWCEWEMNDIGLGS